MLKILPGPFEAYLFDCDGTIADSMPLHHQAWMAALAPWGCGFPADLFYAWAGRPVEYIVELLNQKNGLTMPPKQVAKDRERHYLEMLPQIQAIPEVRSKILEGFGHIPMAVVSGSPKDSVTKTLNFLGLTDYFNVFICAGDYQKGKPDPEPFLLAARKLKVSPEKCLVFEDADLGIEAATAAGMKAVKIESKSYSK